MYMHTNIISGLTCTLYCSCIGLVIETDSSEGVINATEGDFFAISLSAIGNSYDLVPVMITALSYSEYAERGFNLENHFDPNLIPTSAADGM